MHPTYYTSVICPQLGTNLWTTLLGVHTAYGQKQRDPAALAAVSRCAHT
jgi:hypothetical protein